MTQNQTLFKFLAGFTAGFFAVLVFHQVALTILHAINFISISAYATQPTPPFGVPQVLSLAFWGGIWGIILAVLILRSNSSLAWWQTLIFSAIAPTSVFLFVVLPLKGMPIAGGWQPNLIITGLIVNSAWGLGTALLLKLFQSFEQKIFRKDISK
ncbi:hypothetical protein H6G33_28560 [Calothrix sp. FACHB-1219]|uniref:hypothetical protein n=1 Tax=unclassified Calothrix TaxID=2619626 RepID=UPI001683C75A|nr:MULTISPECIES: hypothetical protein [unclassified Calothrix]MBD2204119.1 hypothetical protein [Calothrix sp. FACHB-168]MBD2220933.1 hypothetical protein [Calothrix sp. FACHB-1219]